MWNFFVVTHLASKQLAIRIFIHLETNNVNVLLNILP